MVNLNIENPLQRFTHNKMRVYDTRPFIAWDGEGIRAAEWEPQPYVLFGNSIGKLIMGSMNGLPTMDCFDLLLETKKEYPDAINIVFGGTYDTNQILADLPEEKLDTIHKTSKCNWEGYKIEWYPRKWLYVKSYSEKRWIKLYDVFPFFQSSFLVACKKYLGDNPKFLQIEQGKNARQSFMFEQLENIIIPYWKLELELLVEMMEVLRNDLFKAGIKLSSWHGPGAIATEVFRRFNVKEAINREIPEDVNDAAQYAYAGGRFECFQVGYYPHPVYEYDINSAYPKHTLELPNLQRGYWEFVQTFEPTSFGIWNIKHCGKISTGNTYDPPQPLFCRSKSGLVSYPFHTEGWYWTPEARFVDKSSISGGWVFREDSNDRPFEFVAALYDQRLIWKQEGNTAERALKLALNSLYGKTAQRVGGRDEGMPTWHQLEWAGYITSATRAQIFNAVQSTHPKHIIAIETDAIFSKVPLQLPCSDKLGEWKETKYDSICYLQSGLYYTETHGEISTKYRGLDIDRNTGFPKNLSYRKVLASLAFLGRCGGNLPPFASTSTRYIGMGMALRTNSVWRSWETSRRLLYIGRSNKREHIRTMCETCRGEHPSWYGNLHYCHLAEIGGKSYPHPLPWKKLEDNEDYLETYEDILRWE